MPTFRQLILDASTQPAGSTLRIHMNNLNAGGGGGGGTTIYEIAGFDIEIDPDYTIKLDTAGAVIVLEDE